MQENSHSSPNPELDNTASTRSAKGDWLAALGLILYTGPFWAMMAYQVGMMKSFQSLQDTQNSSAQDLTKNTEFAFLGTMLGISAGFIGMILLLVVLQKMKNRQRWFFWFSTMLAVAWCVVFFPYGMILGIPVAVGFLTKLKEFHS